MSDFAFLSAYIINQAGAARAITQQELNYQCQPGEYIWLHMQSDVEDSQQILQAMNIDDSVSDALCAQVTRPRAMQMDDGVLVFLRGINKNPEADPEDMVSLRVWCTENLIITARRKGRRLLSVQALQDDATSGTPPGSPKALLLDMVLRLADIIHETLEEINDALVDFEDDYDLNKTDRKVLSDLRRQSAAIRRVLAPQRDALDALLRFNGYLDEDQTFFLGEQSDRITRYVEDLDLARERAVVLQDELRNRIADQQGMRMYVLSMVTAIFLPLSFLTGVFGMNVAGLPGTESPDAFTLLMGCMGGLTVVMLVAMLWKRWL